MNNTNNNTIPMKQRRRLTEPSGGVSGWMIRRLFWPLMERYKGNRVRDYLHYMQQFQHESAEQIATDQRDKLTKLLLHAVQTVPAYMDYKEKLEQQMKQPFWDPRQFIPELPVLSKDDFNDRRDDYLSSAVDRNQLIANQTGGSTGTPTRFYLDRVTVEHYEASRWRGLSWHDIHIGDRSVMLWGSSIELSQIKRRSYVWKERFLKNRIVISAYELDETRLGEYVQKLRRFKPKYLYGYASALALFAEMLLRNESYRKQVPALRAVVSTSETLHPHQREAIRKAFGCAVVNEYGARDGGILGFECEQGSLHIPAENCYLEVVDMVTKLPVADGQRGLLLVTDLNNFAMPRLRYELGDVASIREQPCSCGIQLPVLNRVEGRETDVFVTLDGTHVYGAFFNRLIVQTDSFRSFQMIQHAPDRLTLKLVKHPTRYQAQDEFNFIEAVQNVFGNSTEINVEHVEEIPRTASGKLRYAVREFKL